MADERLHCVDESEASSFWILWGDPALQDPYGILCFCDFELKHNRTLLVTSMSDARMRVQLRLLRAALLHESVGKIDRPQPGGFQATA